MYHRSRSASIAGPADGSAPTAAWLFAQAILGNPIPDPRAEAERSRHERELLEFAESISDRARDELRRVQAEEAQVRRDRELLEWVAPISEKRERELRELQREEAEARQRYTRLIESLELQEAQWDPSKHPRRGGPPNAGWFATTGGSGGGAAAPRLRSTTTASSTSSDEADELIVTPRMIQSTGWLGSIREKMRVAGDIAGAFVSGLGTGAKAVVNGLATAARSTVTLGLNTDQLELIGVSKEDRERGYDTAVTISTGSGQVLLAVGTGGMASALAKGGTVARAASGALVAYDSAGNAVGVVQGVYDATQNGVTLANGTQVAAGALGLTANISAAKGLVKPRGPAPTTPTTTPSSPDAPARPSPSAASAKAPSPEFRVGKHGDMPAPRPGQNSHHGVMSAWMERVFPGYDAKKAPAVLMPEKNHRSTFGIYRKWRAAVTKKLEGAFDWTEVSEADMRELSEKMFDAAEAPATVREEYWAEFERMKAALQQQPPQSLESWVWGEHVMSEEVEILDTETMQRRYGAFYSSSPKVHLDKKKVPREFWPLLPYAEFWGIADDWTRQDLVKSASPDVRQNLKQVVAAFDKALDEWLAGPEADDPNPTDEYVAFCAMGMAADIA
jgi:hypothetical protein